jgi:4-hydroxybenzoyl-CoA reductase subunit alpha
VSGDFRKQGDGREEAREVRGWQVGKLHRKVDAVDRMRGIMRYTDDLKLPGMLHGKILRSPHPHARIVSIDAHRALGMPGVFGVVTGKDFPIPYGVIPWTPDENALGLDKVCHVGDGVAAVAAIDEDTAIAALDAIRVEYEPLRPLFDPEEALETTDVVVNPYSKHGNLSKHVELEFGDVEGGLAAADVVIEDEYFFEGTTHTAIEPHCALANLETSGVLTVWSATQVSHYLHRELARVLEMPASRIRVIQPPLGGAFGGKSEPFDLEFCVAKLAMMTGRPVKILYTREEVFYSHRGRHPMKMRYRSGFRKDGTITAVSGRTIIDGGAYSSFGLVTTYYSGQLLCAPYRFPAYKFDSWRAYTNKPACGPKRGHGSVQPRFAIECQLDKAAEKLGIDPIELRRRNDIGSEATTVNELRVGSNGFLECLARVEAASGWKERYGKLPYGRGLGVAGSTYISGTNYAVYPNKMPQAAVQLTRIAAGGRGSSAGPMISGRDRTRCWPSSWPRSSGWSWRTSACSAPTAICARWISAPTARASRSWSGTRAWRRRASWPGRCGPRSRGAGTCRSSGSPWSRGARRTSRIRNGRSPWPRRSRWPRPITGCSGRSAITTPRGTGTAPIAAGPSGRRRPTRSRRTSPRWRWIPRPGW